MKVTSTPHCYPVDHLSKEEFWSVHDDAKDLCRKLMGDLWEQHIAKFKHFTVNLNHPEGMIGLDRFFTLNGKHNDVVDAGYDESQFIVEPDEVRLSALGVFMSCVRDFHEKEHGKPFVGRCQLIWVNPGACYPIHTDSHTLHRYHMALWTNPRTYWMFDTTGHEDFQMLHMPADGRVWYLNPTQHRHTVMNIGTTPRCHLLMTSAQ